MRWSGAFSRSAQVAFGVWVARAMGVAYTASAWQGNGWSRPDGTDAPGSP